MHIVQVAMAHKAEIIGITLAVFDLLAFIPSVKANNLFEAVYLAIKREKEKEDAQTPAA